MYMLILYQIKDKNVFLVGVLPFGYAKQLNELIHLHLNYYFKTFTAINVNKL